jgi:hypothetical protein
MSQDEYRYSQDEIWEVEEPEAAKLSESELAEIARLRDSMGKAVEERFKTVPYSPLLSAPKPAAIENKQAVPPKINIKQSLASIEGLELFAERFPEEFKVKEIRKQARKSTLGDEKAVLLIVCRKMKELMRLYNLADEGALKKPYRKLRIRLLTAFSSRAKILYRFWVARALELNLPEDLAEERAADKTLLAFDPEEGFIPPPQTVKRVFSSEVFKYFKNEKGRDAARRFEKELSLAIDTLEAFSDFFENIKPNTQRKKNEQSKKDEVDLKASCLKFGSLSVPVLGLASPLKTPMLLVLALEVIKALANSGSPDTEQILEWIGTGAGEAIQNDELFSQLPPRLSLAIKILGKTGWIETLCPNAEIQEAVKKIAMGIPSLKAVKGKIPQDLKPGDTLVRQFIQNLLGSPYIEDFNEVDYVARSSERA